MAITKVSQTKFNVNLGFLGVETTWEVNNLEKKAAWEMYVELATRITTAELKNDEGLLREALTSYHSLFGTTRELLKKYGPDIATPANPKETTLGHLAVSILNKVVRPVLAKWHPELQDWEQQKEKDKSSRQHELDWQYNQQLRSTIKNTRLKLIEYANILGTVSGVADLIEDN